jgi:hypothetical protein
MPRNRWSLDFVELPPADQRAWTRSIERRPLFQGRALAAGWAAATRVGVLQAYGQWLHFLRRHGWLDPDALPCNRVTEDRLTAYVAELQARIAPMSVASQLRDLGEAFRVMHPEGDRTLVVEAASFAKANAVPSRNERPKLVAPSDFYDAGLDRMRRVASRLGADLQATMCYEGGMMMATAIAKPLRTRIASSLLVDENLVRMRDGRYGLKLRDGKTPMAAEADAVLPGSLTEFIDPWLGLGRPFLLRGRSSAALWLMPDGGDMTGPSFYYRFCQATSEEFCLRINPHFVRKIMATGISIFEPQLVEIIQHVLDHTSDDMRKQWYDLADRLAASRRYIELLEARRRRAINSTLRE